MIQGLKSFATSIMKWSKHLTDFPTPRFQTPDWQSQCRSVLLEIYGHLCLTDVAVKTALVDTGPRPFSLRCSAPWGALCDSAVVVSRGNLISDILIETRIHLAAGRQASSEWLMPGALRSGLRNAAH